MGRKTRTSGSNDSITTGGGIAGSSSLTPSFQPLRLHVHIPAGPGAAEQRDHRCEQADLPDAVSDGHAAAGAIGEPMVGEGGHASAARGPGERPLGLERGDLPHHRREPWLLDPDPAADPERAAVEALKAGHGGCPFRPSLDVRQHVPHVRARRIDVDGDLVLHGDSLLPGREGGRGSAPRAPLSPVILPYLANGIHPPPPQPPARRVVAMAGFVDELFSLAGSTAVVTGGSSGIGRAIAEALGRAGANVVLVARGSAALRSTVAELEGLGCAAAAVSADLGDRGALRRMAEQAVEPFGEPDVLVNAAGVNMRPPMQELAVEDWDRTMAVNLDAPFLL